jgi:hypothetical protein
MITLLQYVWNAIRSVPFLIADFLIQAFNLVIIGFAVMAAALWSLLPSFPSAPAPPSGGVAGALAWIAPIGTIVTGFSLLVSCWIAFSVIKVALKWVKAL